MNDQAMFYLSVSQQQLLRRGLRSPVLRTQLTTSAAGLDQATLIARWTEAARRHDVLRVAFVKPTGLTGLLQSTDAPAATVTLAADDETPARVIDAEWGAALDLGAGGLIRVALAGDQLVLTAAAAVADPTTLRLLAQELTGGSPAGDDPLPFVDFASWEAEQLEDESADARVARAYWRGLVGDATEAAASTDADPADAPRAVAVPAVPGASPEHWLAALTLIGPSVASASDQAPSDDTAPVLAVAVPGRTDAELEQALGPYQRYVPLVAPAIEPGAPADLTALLVRLASDLDAATRFALFAPDPDAVTAFSVQPRGLRPPVGRYPVELVASETGETTLYVDPARLSATEAGWLADRLARAARACVESPATPVADLQLLGADERAFLDAALTGGGVIPAHRSVADAIAHHTRTSPDAVAVVHGTTTLTYAELDRASHRVAAALPGGDRPVGVLMERSAEAIVAAVGVLRVGRAYAALEPAHPVARLAAQLQVAGIETVLTTVALADRLPPTVTPMLLESLPDAEDTPPAPSEVDGGRIAYLLFTSGSTGTPKPVAVTHANLVAYVAGVSERLGLGPESRMASVTGLSTDLGNTSVFGALVGGGTLEVVPEDAVSSGARLAGLVGGHGVTVLKITPSHLRALLSAGDVQLDLPLLVCGGEPLDLALVERARAAGVARVVNHYGPTETTVGVLTHEVTTEDVDPLPLGLPLAHVRARVVDAAGRQAAVGQTGELQIIGDAVTAGYVGDQQASGFGVTDDGSPTYRTGDLVRVRQDGEVLFVGRADGQVKIRGFRVDLGEIESQLRAQPTVTDAAAVVADDAVRAFVRTTGGAIDAATVLDRLRSTLPTHMVPLAVESLAELPRTPSGKVDRLALATRSTAEAAGVTGATGVAGGRDAATETERRLLEIWREVMPGAVAGVDDNFFRIGGHSLMATKVIARSRAAFAVDVPLHVIFASPTVSEMAAEIDTRRAPDGDVGSSDRDLEALLDDLGGISEEEVARLLESDGAAPGDEHQ